MGYGKSLGGGTKAAAKGGSQGSGRALPVQLGKMHTPHGRDHKAAHPDRKKGK